MLIYPGGDVENSHTFFGLSFFPYNYNTTTETINLKEGETWTLYTLNEDSGYGYGLSGNYPIEIVIDGSIGDVKTDTTENFLINVSVGSHE